MSPPPSPPPPSSPSGSGSDPVLAQRARIQHLVELGQRIGYGLFGLAMALFVIGFVAGLNGALVTMIIGSLIVGSLILAPAIVFGYGVKAANREDREQGRLT